MTVFVLEAGSYEQRHIVGVYATLEDAFDGYPVPNDKPWTPDPRAQGEWYTEHGDFAWITPHEVQGA